MMSKPKLSGQPLQNRFTGLEQELVAALTALDRSNARIAELEQHLAGDEAEHLRGIIAGLEETLRETWSDPSDAEEAKLRELEGEIAVLNELLAAADEEARETDASAARIAELEAELAARNTDIEKLESELAVLHVGDQAIHAALLPAATLLH